MSTLFTEEKYNALYQALEECAKDEDFGRDVYKWMDKHGAHWIMKSLVDKLEELGYIIVKK